MHQNFFIFYRKIALIMSSVLQLEKKLQVLTDQVHDLFSVSFLNIETMKIEMQNNTMPKEINQCILQSRRQLKELQELLKERQILRLNYLITEQIKQEEGKVRRQRLNDYQEKILDQRRLISDKEAFYENLLRPKKKRSPTMQPQDFKERRKKEISEQQAKKYEFFQEEAKKLKQFHQLIKKIKSHSQNNNCQLSGTEKMKENIHTILKTETKKIISKFSQSAEQPNLSSNKKIISQIEESKKQNQILLKQYLEDKEMCDYLQWEKKRLIYQYKQITKEFNGFKTKKISKIKCTNRSMSK